MKLLPLGKNTPDPIHLGRNCPDGRYVNKVTRYDPRVLIIRGTVVLRADGSVYMAKRQLGENYPNWVLEE